MIVNMTILNSKTWLNTLSEHVEGQRFIHLDSDPTVSHNQICMKSNFIDNRFAEDGWRALSISNIISISRKFLDSYEGTELDSLKNNLSWVFSPILRLDPQHRAINNLMEEIHQRIGNACVEHTKKNIVKNHPEATPLREKLQIAMKLLAKPATFSELKAQYRTWIRKNHSDKQNPNSPKKFDESTVQEVLELWQEFTKIAKTLTEPF